MLQACMKTLHSTDLNEPDGLGEDDLRVLLQLGAQLHPGEVSLQQQVRLNKKKLTFIFYKKSSTLPSI